MQLLSSADTVRLPLSRRLLPRLGVLPVADLFIAAAFVAILVLQISRHEMWRDEIHSWGVVLSGYSLPELYENLRFTGHPGLWYLLLWFASWFTDSPFTVQIVHAAIGAVLIGAIALFSPFSRFEKLLLLSSYYVLYEYTVVSRNYGIGFLIAIIYAQQRATRPDRSLWNAALLGLLANTNMFALILSGALAVEYAVELLSRGDKRFTHALRRHLPAGVLYLAFVALAASTMWPSPDISWRTTGAPLADASDPMRFWSVVAGNVEALLPIHPLSYWDDQRKAVEGIASLLNVFALPVLALLFLNIFRQHRQLLIVPSLTAAGSIAAGHLIYATSMRHFGVDFIAFVAIWWMQSVWSPVRSRLVLALLAVSAAAGLAVSVQQFPRTFSEGLATAEWIRDHAPADAALVGTPDTLASVVGQYLGRPIYFLDCSCTDSYLLFHKRRDAFDASQVPERLARAAEDLADRPIVFVISRPLRDAELAELRTRSVAVTHLASFDQATTDENFHVYRIGAGEEAQASHLATELRGTN